MPFEALYRQHFATIWRAVQRFGVPARDAQDAAQEVFLIALRSFAQFEGRSSPRTWLFGIAYRVALGRLRKAGARLESLVEPAFTAQLSPAPDPESCAEQRELRALCDAALAALPLEQRAVFTLFELEGLSGEEIAAALGLPLGTVRSRLRLARAAFSKSLHALGASGEGLEATPLLEASHD